MRNVQKGKGVSEVIVGRIPYEEPGKEQPERDKTRQEVWAQVHSVYGHPNQNYASRVLYGLKELREEIIARSLEEIAGDKAKFRHTLKVLFENAGFHEQAEKVDEFINDNEKLRTLRKSLLDNTVVASILLHTNFPRIKFLYRQPYYHTTAGILTSRLKVADAFVNALLARNPRFFGERELREEERTYPPHGGDVYGEEHEGYVYDEEGDVYGEGLEKKNGEREWVAEPPKPTQLYGPGVNKEKIKTKERTIGELLWILAQNHIDTKDGLLHLRKLPRGSIDPALARLWVRAANFVSTLQEAYPARRKLSEETMHRLLAAANTNNLNQMFYRLIDELGSEADVLEKYMPDKPLNEKHFDKSEPSNVLFKVNLLNFEDIRDKNGDHLTEEQKDAIAFHYLAKLAAQLPHEDFGAVSRALAGLAAQKRKDVEKLLRTALS